MLIQDPIHGYIQLDGLEMSILDTEEFQRLRRIKQLGFSNLVYPSATHTRFEHSLGSTYLAGKFAEYLDIDDSSRKHLRAASMLHDIGHGPFSHTSEEIFLEKGMSHEDFSKKKIRRESVSEVLEEHGVNPEKVISLIEGEGELGQIIAGDIDIDRMDYLMRDAHYSGVAHGVIDDETIMRAATFREGKLVFKEKFKPALEGLLTARYLMTPTVYMHRAVMRAEKMMERAIEELMESEDLGVEKIAYMDDIDLKYRLRNTENDRARFLNECLDNRRVFKPAFELDNTVLSREELRNVIEEVGTERDIEESIAEGAGVDVKNLVVDVPPIPKKSVVKVDVLRDNEIVGLSDISNICSSISKSVWENTSLSVYCKRDMVETVEESARDFFDFVG